MVPLLGLGHIFAYLYKSALWKRIFLIVSTVPISIVLNSARIAITGVLVDRYGTQLAEGFFHAFQGWLIFMISTGILCVELLILNRIGGKRIDLVTMFRDAYDAVSINVRKGDAVQRHIPNTLIGALVVTSVTGMVTLVMETRDEYIPERPPFAIFPDTIGPWTGNRLFGIADQMASIGADDYLLSNYRKDSTPGLVELYIAYFDKQTDDKNPHSPKACIPGGGWEISSITRVEKSIGRGRSIMVNKMLIQRGVNQQLLYYWFNLHGRNIADEYKMKAYLLKDRVLLSRTDGALIRITSLRKNGESLEMVENRLDSFLVSMDPVIDQFIPAI
jgi:exosortase D (VPLPA-CTERM-specific)